MFNMSKECKFTRLNNAVAAGQTTVTTAALDLLGKATGGQSSATVPCGFDAICILVLLNTVTATGVITVTLEDATTTGGTYTKCTSGFADFGTTNAANATVAQDSTFTGIAVTDVGGNSSNGIILLDVVLPQSEFVKVVVARSVANSTLDGIVGILYRGKQRPVVHDATSIVATGFFVATT